MNMIIDTDPGIDDAMAIYYAVASDRIKLRGLTTIFGNVSVQNATRNALWLGESVGLSLPVFEGADRALQIAPTPPSAHVHGPNGFGDVTIDPPTGRKAALSAAEELVRAAAEAPGTLTVCAIGPLTNIALALQLDSNFVSNLRQLVIMGGSLYAGGNITPYAEANFWHDPHAAHQVLTAPGTGTITVVGLDVTTKIAFGAEHYQQLEQAAPRIGSLVNRMGQFYMRFYESVTGTYQAFVHDAAAVIACEQPELFEMEEHCLGIVMEGDRQGEMIKVDGSGRKCRVCVGVDPETIVSRYFAAFATLS